MDDNEGLIFALLLDGQGGATTLDRAGIARWEPGQGVLWVHLDYAHPNTRRWLREDAQVDPLVADALTDEDSRPRSDLQDDGLLVGLRGVNTNPGAEPEDMVSIRLYCTAHRVISARHRRLLTVSDMAAALAAGTGPRTCGEILSTLASRLTERLSGVIRDIDDRLDTLEERVVAGGDQKARAILVDLRREVITLRRFLAPQREALSRLQSEKLDWLPKTDRRCIRESNDKLTRHLEDLDAARDRASVAYEELSSNLAEQLNSRMYVLSVIAGLFLPLGFLTGLLGINVGGIPLAESPLGFVLVVLFLVAVVVLQFLVFRRKGWL